MLGQKSIDAAECFAGSFIGTDFGIDQDLSNKLPEEWRAFNREFIPIYLATHPDKTKSELGWHVELCGRSPKELRRGTSCCARMVRDSIVWAK
jgi:restriction system protein